MPEETPAASASPVTDQGLATPRVQPERQLVKWTAASRPFRRRGRQFFTTVLVIAVLVGIILVFAKEWMLIATLAAMVFAYYVWSTIPPEEVEYAISTRGVRVHGQLYRWEDLTRWWVEEKWGQKLLVVESGFGFPRRLFLVLAPNSEDVEKVMADYLEMDKPVETAMDKAGRWVTEKFPLET